ncbi:hypothetical protein [Zhihengliuella flava]|uniref:Uncharacterized protein n=1 Tax=Zhihengliuella flava TaxID=1285193 RepID=A0A931DC21_9MICC|nr:hypothetical protein [Zhihengliuella flava]MBG6085828.1 hypothetical protein [Zhihengliuella flava]
MDTTLTKGELELMLDRLAAFRKRFEQLHELCEVGTGMYTGGYGYMWARDGHEDDVKEIKIDLGRLAGLAEPAIAATQSYVLTEVHGQVQNLSPVSAWLTCMQPRPALGPEDILMACRSAEGRLTVLIEDRKKVEGTFAWKIARLIGWPKRVRDLAGLTADSAGGRATVYGLGALMFGALASVIGSIIWAGVTAAMKLTGLGA